MHRQDMRRTRRRTDAGPDAVREELAPMPIATAAVQHVIVGDEDDPWRSHRERRKAKEEHDQRQLERTILRAALDTGSFDEETCKLYLEEHENPWQETARHVFRRCADPAKPFFNRHINAHAVRLRLRRLYFRGAIPPHVVAQVEGTPTRLFSRTERLPPPPVTTTAPAPPPEFTYKLADCAKILEDEGASVTAAADRRLTHVLATMWTAQTQLKEEFRHILLMDDPVQQSIDRLEQLWLALKGCELSVKPRRHPALATVLKSQTLYAYQLWVIAEEASRGIRDAQGMKFLKDMFFNK